MKQQTSKFNDIREAFSSSDLTTIGITLTAMICVMLAIAFNFSNNKVSVESYTLDSMRKVSHNYELQINRYINNKMDVLNYMQTFPDIYQMDRKKQKAFIMTRSQLLDFHHMFVLDKDGYGYYIEENIIKYQKDDDFYKTVMNEDTFVTAPWSDPKRFFSIITLCTSIRNPKGEKVGVLCGALDLSKIQDFIGANETLWQGDYALITKDGQYISGSRISSRTVYKQQNFFNLYAEDSDTSLVVTALKNKENAFGTINLKGTLYNAYVTYMPEYDWAIVQYIAKDSALKDSRHVEYLQYALVILMLLLLFTVMRILQRWMNTNRKLRFDHLTSCLNRLSYELRLDELENNYNDTITIIYMDLNKFKYVNDTFGHDNGDLLLHIFADSLQQFFSSIGNIYRIGGDEFVCISINHGNEEINDCWKRLEEDLKNKSKFLNFDYTITASYGYAIREKGCQDALRTILDKADQSMYHYKHAWRRRQQVEQQMEKEKELQKNLKEQQIFEKLEAEAIRDERSETKHEQ